MVIYLNINYLSKTKKIADVESFFIQNRYLSQFSGKRRKSRLVYYMPYNFKITVTINTLSYIKTPPSTHLNFPVDLANCFFLCNIIFNKLDEIFQKIWVAWPTPTHQQQQQLFYSGPQSKDLPKINLYWLWLNISCN